MVRRSHARWRSGSRECSCNSCASMFPSATQARPTVQKARCTAGRSRAGGLARTSQNCRKKATASGPNLPPTSMASTTSLQRRATASSGYVWRRLRFAACSSAVLGTRSACGCAPPARATGETRMVSTAAWTPCQRGHRAIHSPVPRCGGHQREVRRRSWPVRGTLIATRAPASRQTRAAAFRQAVPWLPKVSSAPPHRHRHGPIGMGSRKRLSNTTRKHELESRNSGSVGNAVWAREKKPGPAWDSINAREAGSRSEKRPVQARAGRPPSASSSQEALQDLCDRF